MGRGACKEEGKERKPDVGHLSVGRMGGDPRTREGVINATSRGGLAGCAICVQDRKKPGPECGREWKLRESSVAPSVGPQWHSGFHLVFPFPGGWPVGGGAGVSNVSLLF